jgi:ABC-type dipeptide/oligopeptide/nickel transport system permease component
MKKFKTSLILIGVGVMNFLHAILHILQFVQSLILVKTSISDSHHSDSILDSLLHNPYFAFLWAIIGIATLWIGIKDYKHHKECQDH